MDALETPNSNAFQETEFMFKLLIISYFIFSTIGFAMASRKFSAVFVMDQKSRMTQDAAVGLEQVFPRRV